MTHLTKVRTVDRNSETKEIHGEDVTLSRSY